LSYQLAIETYTEVILSAFREYISLLKGKNVSMSSDDKCLTMC